MIFKIKSSVEKLLTEENKRRVVDAIKQAEKNTSGEIRVHIEAETKNKTPFDKAIKIFEQLGMCNTKLRNGVLIYVALDDRKFAIIGDKGINEKLGAHFWEQEKNAMADYFKRNEIIEGIIYFIDKIGEKLKAFFPYHQTDINELPDEISTNT